jgi:hypothetical protein
MIKVASSRAEIREFLKFPWEIYKQDSAWCAPFVSECKKMFFGKHPFHEYGEMKLFVAYQGERCVGRVAAIKNARHNEQHQDKTGFFGFFECIDDPAVAKDLLDAAKSHLKEQGFDRMVGPASPSSTYDYGCQFSGFEHDQVLLSTHNAPYYLKLFEGYGLQKTMDLYAYRVVKDKLTSSPGWKLLSKLEKRSNQIKIRPWNKNKAQEEILNLTKIFNQCWAKNHGFIPITLAEGEFLYSSLKPLLDSKLVLFAELDGEVVGGAIYILDYNQIFKTFNGRLFPWNLAKIFTQKKSLTSLRAFMAGVVPEHRNKNIFPLMLSEVIKTGFSYGIDNLEASYILENNHFMRAILEKIGGEIYKEYRVFETSL